MLSVLVANIKGGCGKTTIATNLAAALANAGRAVALADADRQQSAMEWLGRRPKGAAPIVGLNWAKGVGEAPKRTELLIIDCPAALKMKQIEELVALADLIVLPVLPSTFDERATARFLERLDGLKPVRKNRKGVTIVGNRLRPRTRASRGLDRFLGGAGHEVVARLRDSAIYTDVAAKGLGVFDLKSQRFAPLQEEWAPLVAHVENGG